MPAGRPTKYTPELAAAICEDISNSSCGIHQIAKNHNVTATSIMEWLGKYKEFAEMYARAKDLQADYMAKEMIEIADEATRDTITDPETGNEYANNEWIQRSKLRVETRKWLAAKLAPKKYGDKIDVTTDGQPISHTTASIKLSNGTTIDIWEN